MAQVHLLPLPNFWGNNFGEMKNFCIFVLSNIRMRGVEPATQGGFFCVPAKGFSTYKRRPAFTESGFRPGNTRASGVLDSGTVRAAFLFRANVQHTHYVHRNFSTSHPPAIPASGRQNGCRRPENPARIVAQPAQSQYLRAFRAARIRGQSFNVASQFFTHLFLTAA